MISTARFCDIGYDIKNKKARQIDTESHRNHLYILFQREISAIVLLALVLLGLGSA